MCAHLSTLTYTISLSCLHPFSSFPSSLPPLPLLPLLLHRRVQVHITFGPYSVDFSLYKDSIATILVMIMGEVHFSTFQEANKAMAIWCVNRLF